MLRADAYKDKQGFAIARWKPPHGSVVCSLLVVSAHKQYVHQDSASSLSYKVSLWKFLCGEQCHRARRDQSGIQSSHRKSMASAQVTSFPSDPAFIN